jgi:hypothetical protein
MADLADVERGFVTQIAAALFPGTTYVAGALAACAAAGLSVRVYRGWPNAALLDADIAAGRAHVSVFSEPSMGRNTTRYQDEWTTPTPIAKTLTATVAGAAITFGGTAALGHVVGIQVGNGTAPVAYPYRVQAGATPTSVAAAFDAMIPGATAAGAVLTLPTTAFRVAVVRDQASWLETRRQVQIMRLSTWTPTPAARDAVAGALDVALSRTRWLPLADGSSGRLIYQGTHVYDATGKAAIWRRDLRYEIEYATTFVEQQPECLFTPIHADVGAGALVIIGPEAPAVAIYTDVNGDVIVDAGGSLLGETA